MNQLKFDGSKIVFDENKTINDYFDVECACRKSKPCDGGAVNGRMCFFATYKETGQKVILKTITKKVIGKDGVPYQCSIDELKETIGLNKMGTHYGCIKGRPVRKEKNIPWSVRGEPINFDYDLETMTDYVIIEDRGYNMVVADHKDLIIGKNGYDELQKIVVFRFVCTRDNGFANVMMKKNDGVYELVSIDEENNNDEYVSKAESLEINLSEYFEGRFKAKVTKKILDDMKNNKEMLKKFLGVMKNAEPIFEEYAKNIDAISGMLDMDCKPRKRATKKETCKKRKNDDVEEESKNHKKKNKKTK